MTTLEGNKLIAEFMGWEANKYSHLPNKLHKIDTGQEVGIHIDQMEYHTSWDWLMPVVEKIGGMPSISIDIKKYTVEHGDRGVSSCGISRTYWPEHGKREEELITHRLEFTDKVSQKQLIWEQIIQFIQWYNKQNTPAKVDDKKGDY